jgi:outer membrane protein TolC
MKQLIIFLISILFFNECISQRVLSLEESIKIALKESYSINSANLSVESSRKSLESVRKNMYSKVDISFDLPRYYSNLSPQFNPLTGLTEYYQIEETRYQTNLTITQPIIFSNGTLSLIGSLFQREQVNNSLPTRDYYGNAAIQLRQPLFAANSQRNSLIRAEKNLEKTESQYTRTQFDIVYNVTQSFYSLYQSIKQLEISSLNVDQRRDAYETSKNKFQAGIIPEVEMLQLEVELASGENELLTREQSVEQQKNSFKVLIGLPLNEDIGVVPELDYTYFEIDSAKAVALVLQNDANLKAARIDYELQEYSIDEIKSRGRLRADIVANYGINKNDTEFNYLVRDLAETKSVSLSISIPLFDWGSNSLEVEAAEATYKNYALGIRNSESLIMQEILDIIKRIKLAKSKIDVVTKALEVANKSYSISLERYKTGQIKSDEMVNEQKRLINSKNEHLSAIIEYKKSVAELTRKAYYDFETDKPLSFSQ